MSTTTQLPDPRQAYQNLFAGVHERVFFNKCAAAGFAPRSQEEAQYMLDTAGKLRYLSQQEPIKQAAAQDNPYYQMSSHLDAMMAQYGLGGGRPQESESAIKAAADQLAADPVLYNSVLSLAAYEHDQAQRAAAGQ